MNTIDCSPKGLVLAICVFTIGKILMDIQHAFAVALKQARKASGLTQEDFSDVSSRTYISTLERGLKNPTIEKVDSLSKAMRIHPLTLLSLTYLIESNELELSNLLNVVSNELNLLITCNESPLGRANIQN